MPTLRAQLRARYGARSLPAERLERLRGLVEAATPKRSPRRAALLAAAAVLAAAALFLVLRDRGPNAATRAVAGEIAKNHRKGYETEFDATDIEALRLRMDSLDFAPVAPAELVPGAVPLGARYCSVAAHVAVQFRIRDAAGAIGTLYLVRDREVFDAVEACTVDVDGVTVRLWRHGELLVGLAR